MNYDNDNFDDGAVRAYGINFNLNRPHKYTVYGLLTRLQISGIIRINGVDDIITSENIGWNHTSISKKRYIGILKQVIKYAHYLEHQANLQEVA